MTHPKEKHIYQLTINDDPNYVYVIKSTRKKEELPDPKEIVKALGIFDGDETFPGDDDHIELCELSGEITYDLEACLAGDPAPPSHFFDRFGKNGIWNSVPAFPREDWKDAVHMNETSLGYWEWVQSKMENANLVFYDAGGKPVDNIIVHVKDNGRYEVEGIRDGIPCDLTGDPSDLSLEELEDYIGVERFMEVEEALLSQDSHGFDVRETNELYAKEGGLAPSY